MKEGVQTTEITERQVVTPLDHVLYYIHPQRLFALAYLRRNGLTVDLATIRSRYIQDATLATCVAQLNDAGIRTAAVDVTSPDVALAPLRVVRAFGTYIQPIHFGSANRRLSNPRLQRLLSEPPESLPHPIA